MVLHVVYIFWILSIKKGKQLHDIIEGSAEPACLWDPQNIKKGLRAVYWKLGDCEIRQLVGIFRLLLTDVMAFDGET